MKLTQWDTTDLKRSTIGLISIEETINKSTDQYGTRVKYITLFYDRSTWDKKEIPLPMISNHSLDHIETEEELRKLLRSL